jgi:hypothetical protein
MNPNSLSYLLEKKLLFYITVKKITLKKMFSEDASGNIREKP